MASSSEWIREATDGTFDEEVIQKSHTLPVIVDFWAPWCAPCAVLTPALERAINDRGGKVVLVKVNVDKHQAVAARFRVRNIPVIKGFVDGEVKSELVGPKPPKIIRDFIDLLIPSEELEALAAAEKLLSEGAHPQALERVAPLTDHGPYRDRALLLKAKIQVAEGGFDVARQSLEKIPRASSERAQKMYLELKIDLLSAGAEGKSSWKDEAEARPKDAEVRWALAGWLWGRGETEGALEALLEILKNDRDYRDDGARKAMLAIFDEIGLDHRLAHEYRRQMQIYL